MEPVEASSAPAPEKPKAVKRSMPAWEEAARDRLKAAVKKYQKPLADLVERDVNEADIRLFITDFLCDALGYDKYSDLSTEYRVKGEYADYGVRIDKQLVAFIEVKRPSTVLGTKHLRQVEMYAVNEGVEWIILTNGAVWQIYHVTGGLPVVIDLAFAVNLLGEESVAKKAESLYYLTKESLKRRQIDELWKAKRAMSPKSLAQIVCSAAVTEAIRKELKRQTGYSTEAADIIRVLKEVVIRPGCCE
ncbi:MAG TPA: type I restriction enzyme HsdR N-terminal domain-containing protein [Armatimonadota bacterium]|nr:type I restriction enzyme HsdR N-terminal domain-containing protein [Armatimonadota bacterium]